MNAFTVRDSRYYLAPHSGRACPSDDSLSLELP